MAWRTNVEMEASKKQQEQESEQTKLEQTKLIVGKRSLLLENTREALCSVGSGETIQF